jgi:hypothetical protein
MWRIMRTLAVVILFALSFPAYPQEKKEVEKKARQPMAPGTELDGLFAVVVYMSHGVASAKANIEETLRASKMQGTAALLNSIQDRTKKWLIVPREIMQVEDYTKQVPVRVRLRDDEQIINVGWNFPLEYADGPQWLCGLVLRDVVLIEEVQRGTKISEAQSKALEAQALFLRASEQLSPSKDKRVAAFLANPPKTMNPKEIYLPAKENIDEKVRSQNRKRFAAYLSEHGAGDLAKSLEAVDENKVEKRK